MEILLENQSIPIEAFQENSDMTNSITGSLFTTIIQYLITNDKIDPVTDIHNVAGIAAGVGTIILANSVNKTGSEIQTVFRVQGFNLGVLLGGFAGIRMAREAITHTVPHSTKFVTGILSYILYRFLANNTNIVNIANKIVGKILKKIIILPDYKSLLKDAATTSMDRLTVNPNTLIYSSLVGYFIGLFGTYYIIKKFSNVSFQQYLDGISATFNSSSGSLAQSVLLGFASRTTNIDAQLTPIKPKISKTVNDFSNIVNTLFLNKNKTKNFSNNKSKTFSVKNLYKELTALRKNTNHDLVTEKIMQAVYGYSIKDKNFNKFINSVSITKGSHDNAYAIIHIGNNKGYRIGFIVANENSFYENATIPEIQAIIAHELGHIITGIFRIGPIALLIKFLIAISSGISNPFVQNLVHLGSLHALYSFGRLSEIQADGYAIRQGLGDDLHSVLTRIVPDYYNELSSLDVHDDKAIRMDAIKHATKEFYQFKKKILSNK